MVKHENEHLYGQYQYILEKIISVYFKLIILNNY